MVKYKRKKDELKEYWDDQINFLIREVNEFDNGSENEARRIASCLRILLHETKYSKSLVGQIGINLIYFSSSSFYNPANLLTSWTLLTLRLGPDGIQYLPNIIYDKDSRYFCYTFDDWWNEVIFDDKSNVFTRKDIILFVANNDGGAHVDPELKESFFLLSKQNSLGIVDNFDQAPENNPIYQAVRSIAEEFLISLKIREIGLKTRKQCKDKTFEMRFFDDSRRYKWSSTEINVSEEIMEIVNQHRVEDRKLYLQILGNGMKVEFVGK